MLTPTAETEERPTLYIFIMIFKTLSLSSRSLRSGFRDRSTDRFPHLLSRQPPSHLCPHCNHWCHRVNITFFFYQNYSNLAKTKKRPSSHLMPPGRYISYLCSQRNLWSESEQWRKLALEYRFPLRRSILVAWSVAGSTLCWPHSTRPFRPFSSFVEIFLYRGSAQMESMHVKKAFTELTLANKMTVQRSHIVCKIKVHSR